MAINVNNVKSQLCIYVTRYTLHRAKQSWWNTVQYASAGGHIFYLHDLLTGGSAVLIGCPLLILV